MLQQTVDGVDVWKGQLITLGLGSCKVGQPTNSPCNLHPQGELSSAALTSSPSSNGKGVVLVLLLSLSGDWLPDTYTFRISTRPEEE